MKLGVTSMVFFTRPLNEAISAIARCGFDCVEIWPEHIWQYEQEVSAPAIKQQLTEEGLEATVHCPIMDVNMTSPNPGIRQESIRQLVDSARFAKDIGARLMVLHPGHTFSPREDLNRHWKLQVAAVKEVVNAATEIGLPIAYENMEIDNPKVTVTNENDIRRVMEECNLPGLGVTLDTAHMRDTKRIVKFIESLGSSIIHTHISDSTSNKLHLLVGEGELDFAEIFAALKSVGYNGVYSLETFIPGDEAILRKEREKLGSYLA